MPDHDAPSPNTFAPNEPMKDVFRTRTELVETLNRYRENLRWYVEERNRLIAENESFRAEIERAGTRKQCVCEGIGCRICAASWQHD